MSNQPPEVNDELKRSNDGMRGLGLLFLCFSTGLAVIFVDMFIKHEDLLTKFAAAGALIVYVAEWLWWWRGVESRLFQIVGAIGVLVAFAGLLWP